MKGKIYCTIVKEKNLNMNIALAVSSDGDILAKEPGETPEKAKFNLGLGNSKKNHAVYKKAFPKGFDLKWLDEPGKSKDFIAAMKNAHLKKSKKN